MRPSFRSCCATSAPVVDISLSPANFFAVSNAASTAFTEVYTAQLGTSWGTLWETMKVDVRAGPVGPSAPQLNIEKSYVVRPKIVAPTVVYHAMTSRLRGSSLLNPQSCNRSPPSPNPPHPASGRGFAPVIKPSRDILTSKITFPIGLPPGYLDTFSSCKSLT